MSSDNINAVRQYYDNHAREEDQRLDEHPFEIPVTMHFVKKYLAPGCSIFDAACGTGRIAEMLLNKGFFVGLNDLSGQNVELAEKRCGRHRNVLFIERSDVLESIGWRHKLWDSIFLLGPLYHIISKERKLQLLKLAYNNLKPEGFLFSSFMTRAGALIYGIKHNPDGIHYNDGAKKLWKTGTDDRFIESTDNFTNAYFAHPEEVNPLIERAGLKPLHLAGAEGIFGERFELFHNLQDNLKREWIQFVIENCEDMHLVQQSKHLLSVARKPARSVQVCCYSILCPESFY
jgi:S-adenosylmethionine-dependent methyltransferase